MHTALKQTGKRLLALLLCTVLALSAAPLAPGQQAAAADWTKPYVDKLQGWGVVNGYGDGSMGTNRAVTRAEFVAMMNRAYGYTDVGPIPFVDVPRNAWYYEDICKAYVAGVLTGSGNKASPNDPITREQALVLIARNMRMEETPGEVIAFTDGRDFSPYSRGYVPAAITAGVIGGYADGTFRPKRNVTRGEAMKMLCVGLGTLINEPGTHAPGGVFGNLTINTTNVVLKDSIIAGDLYISGGVSLGDVVLENVQVLGRIIIAGGGASEMGQNSILLRGVEAREIIVDAPTGQYISVRTEGRTQIQKGFFRSDSFLEDGCRDGYGILNVSLEGNPGDSFTLSGNLENVVNRTPDSTLTVGDAQASQITIDEKATGSQLVLEINAAVDNVNLDVGTIVTGSGDIGHLTINAPGSSTTMLPDKITIRPGLEADIAGDTMDPSEAIEFSEKPRLLAGYPKAANVAPTSADAVASTNKAGTIYWGLTAASMGPVPDTDEGKERLISPSYGAGFVLSGNMPADSSNTDYTAALTGLTSSGTYFVSAMLVDAKGQRSPVYSESFETPDDTQPAFSSKEYPYMSSIMKDEPYATVMANKNCDLYYVLLPQGSTAPTPNEFMSFSFSDPLGYGRIPLKKNKTDSIQVNRVIYPTSMDLPDKVTILEEQVTYELYLFLCDADGSKASKVTQLKFTTKDETPPEFSTELQQTTMAANSVGVNCVLNEPGTVYWALVPVGREYPVPARDSGDKSTDEAFLKGDYAKLQVEFGQNADQSGSIKTNGNVNATATLSKLQPETSYDVYYIAKDTAGNYSDIVKKVTVYTQDSTPPTAELTFSHVNQGTNEPYPDSDVTVVFSENIMYRENSRIPLNLYDAAHNTSNTPAERQEAQQELEEVLRNTIHLVQRNGSIDKELPERTSDDQPGEWGLDYRKATLKLDREGKLLVTFPGGAVDSKKGINLGSGSTYLFTFGNITDASPAKNLMKQDRTVPFTTVSALAHLNEDVNSIATPDGTELDIRFSMEPDSTSTTEDGLRWNMMLWFNTACKFEMYRRVRTDANTNTNDGWTPLGAEYEITGVPSGGYTGVRLSTIVGGREALPWLVDDKDNGLPDGTVYEYGIHFTSVNGSTDRLTFNTTVECKPVVLTGSIVGLDVVTSCTLLSEMQEALAKRSDVVDISDPAGFSVEKPFVDSTPPTFSGGAPRFEAGDSGVNMTLHVSRPNTRVYYVIAPANALSPTDSSNKRIDLPDGATQVVLDKDGNDNSLVPADGNRPQIGAPGGDLTKPSPNMNFPSIPAVMDPDTFQLVGPNTNAVSGTVTVSRVNQDFAVNGLKPTTVYYAYFVLEGSSNSRSNVYVYKFTTTEVSRPVLRLNRSGSNITISTTSGTPVNLSYIVVPYTSNMGTQLYDDIDLNGKKVKVFQAMGQDADSADPTKGSLFDAYADDNKKGDLYNYIDGASPNSSILVTGKGTISNGKPLLVDCSKEEALHIGTEYCFVVTGRSQTGSGAAFRSTYPFTITDQEAPKVEKLLPVGLEVTSDRRIKGSISLVFNEQLYYLKPPASSADLPKKYQVTNSPNVDNNNDNYISVTALYDGATPDVQILTDSKVVSPTGTATVTVQYGTAAIGVGDGAFCTFSTNLCDSVPNTRTSPPLTITARIGAINEEKNTAEVIVEIPREWTTNNVSSMTVTATYKKVATP